MFVTRFRPGETSDDVAIAQARALQDRVPILYAVLAINTAAMAVTHVGVVSNLLAIYIPGIFITVMAWRAYYWHIMEPRSITAAEARRLLTLTTILGAAVAALLLAWAAMLYPYKSGGALDLRRITEHGQTVLYVGITMICCVTLLMHVRAAAVLTTLIVSIPFCLFLIWHGSLVEWAVAVNLALVTFAMLYVGVAFARDFAQLVDSRAELGQLHAQQRLLANTDALTGLDNRRRFYATLDEVAAANEPFAVMIVDLDGFKQINDLHGHKVGDEVLHEIAGRIASASSNSLCAARLGGDEFGILVGPEPSAEALVQLGQEIIEACSLPIRLEHLTVSVGASVGINVVSHADLKAPLARHVERADYALFHVKQHGRGGVEVFTFEHERRIKRSGLVEQTLRAANLESELVVVYQPIVHSAAQALRGFEALVRWNSPTLGSVSPGEFIPIAEHSDLIHVVTRFVLRTTLGEAHRWPAHVRLKINLSARDLTSPEQMLALLAILRSSEVDPRRLTFEITETALGESVDAVQAAVTMIKATGAAVAVDDFGTGYSSLSIIHQLNPDLIKIDRSFIMRLGESESATSMVKTIIEMCRNIGARSLAEGVEEVSQVRELTAMGCDELQGFLFSRPIDAVTAEVIANGGIQLDGTL